MTKHGTRERVCLTRLLPCSTVHTCPTIHHVQPRPRPQTLPTSRDPGVCLRGATYREHVLDEHQQVLDGLVLGDVAQQVEERLGALLTLLPHQSVPLGGVTQRVVVRHDEVVVFLADHLRSDEREGW